MKVLLTDFNFSKDGLGEITLTFPTQEAEEEGIRLAEAVLQGKEIELKVIDNPNIGRLK